MSLAATTSTSAWNRQNVFKKLIVQIFSFLYPHGELRLSGLKLKVINPGCHTINDMPFDSENYLGASDFLYPRWRVDVT